MKETVSVSIASEAFTLDDDACRVLRNYFDEIRSRLPEDDSETMNDIEARVAEIFHERVNSPMRVISLDVVRAAMNQLGAPEVFGTKHEETHSETLTEEPESEKKKKLYRSRRERAIGGVCSGIAEYFDTDPTLIRLVTLMMIFLGGLSIWVYIILWIVIPNAPMAKLDLNNKTRK